MKDTKEKIIKLLIMGVSIGIMVSAATLGTSKTTVNAKGRTAAQPAQEQKVEEKSEGQKEAERFNASFEGQVANSTTTAMFAIGDTQGAQGGGKVGGGVQEMTAVDSYTSKVAATGANLNMGEVPYAKESNEIGPVAKSVITNAAASQGFLPGGMFDLEIGTFTTNGGAKVCSKLNAPQNFDVYITNLPGYKAGIMMLLPDGTTQLLDDKMLDRTYENAVKNPADANSKGAKLVLKTTVPKAVYMLVYMPQ